MCGKTIFLIVLVYAISAFPQTDRDSLMLDSLKRRVEKLETRTAGQDKEQQGDEMQKLRRAAQNYSGKTESESDEAAGTQFREGSRSLQALNPEISVTGDLLTRGFRETPEIAEEARSGFLMRVLGVHIQSNLDPFSMAKASLEWSAEGVGLAEAYLTWTNPLPRLTLTAGKFRQQFGIINRWHEHALDQVDFPLPIVLYMGEEGLAQSGVSINYLSPLPIADASELTVQITNAANELLFSGEDFDFPSLLFHWKNYYDLSRSTYLEWGLSGLAGPNDGLGFTFSRERSWTTLAGADLSVSWQPAGREKYRGIIWRSELFRLNRQQYELPEVTAWGGYTYLDFRLSRRFMAGIRGDIAQIPELENEDTFLWQISPCLTFWQSEFVYLRLQYNHLRGYHLSEKGGLLMLQIDWAMGPHKHERY
ncbi:MAG: hypothetical protein WAN36_12935 [Calditrichia bacterium]